MENNFIPDGALIDVRPQGQKQKDYKAEEIASGHTDPFTHNKVTALTATVYSQEQTSSCVTHAVLTQLEYEGIVLPNPQGISQLLTYRRRNNYPSAGSMAVDNYERIKEGQKYNYVSPVLKGETEATANKAPYLIGEHLIKNFNYFEITNRKNAPSDVAQGKAVVIFIFATIDEWSQEYVEVKHPLKLEDAAVRHGVCLIPNGDFTENGKQWLSVHDSAAFGGRHLRYISNDFLNTRSYYASKVYIDGEVKPPLLPSHGNPVVACQFNDRNKNVQELQSYLITQGYLEPQYLTGLYGALTANAVLEWQLTNNQLFTYMRPVRELLSYGGKYWGAQSIEAFNKLNH